LPGKKPTIKAPIRGMINKVVSIVILDEGDGEAGDHKLKVYGRGARLAPSFFACLLLT
jgi:hypothetical protein